MAGEGQSRHGFDLDLFPVGRTVRLRARSPLHKGIYECTVTALDGPEMRVTMPTEEGKLVFIPVGTRVHLQPDEEKPEVEVEAVIVDRHGGKARGLVLRPGDGRADEADTDGEEALCPVVAVTSGKGGVGKSFVAINLGAALTEIGLKVAIVDADLGTANVDVLLNLAPRHTLSEVARDGRSIFDALVEGPRGLVVLPGGSGLQDLTEMTEGQFRHLHGQMKLLQRYVDVLILDTGSGVSRAVTRFVLAADEAVLVTTPEPHAIVDGYALVKVLSAYESPVSLHLVVNKSKDEAEARAVASKMVFAGERFLQTNMQYLGWIAMDEAVDRAVRGQRLLVDVRGSAPAAEGLRRIAAELTRRMALPAEIDARAIRPREHEGRPRSFLQRMRQLLTGQPR